MAENNLNLQLNKTLLEKNKKKMSDKLENLEYNLLTSEELMEEWKARSHSFERKFTREIEKQHHSQAMESAFPALGATYNLRPCPNSSGNSGRGNLGAVGNTEEFSDPTINGNPDEDRENANAGPAPSEEGTEMTAVSANLEK